MTPFQRLGLFAAGAALAGSMMAVAVFVSGWVAAAMVVGGLAIATVATLERIPLPAPETTTDPTLETGAVHVSTRAEVERRARRDRDDDFDE